VDPLSVIQRLGSGHTLEDLCDALTATAQEVVATGKPGTITLTLKVSNKGQGNPLVIVEETVARTSPKKDPKGAIFFALDGALHREDPRQTRMDFRILDPETGEIREVPEARRERIIE
jgi:hypothetical protein